MTQNTTTFGTDELIALTAQAAADDPTREGEERWALVHELHSRTEQPVLEAALEWCSDDDPLLRSLAADVLGQLGAKDEHPFASESVEPLGVLLGDADPTVVASSLVALGHLRAGDLDAILAHAAHEEASVRESVAFALCGREEDGAVRTLCELSKDTTLEVRNWATFALGSQTELDRPELRLALVNRLEDDDHEVRGEAMVGLARRGDARATPAILAELQMDDVSVLAVEAASELPDRRYLPELEVLLETNPEDPGIQLAVQMCQAL